MIACLGIIGFILLLLAVAMKISSKIITGGSKQIEYSKSAPLSENAASDMQIWDRTDLQVNPLLKKMYKHQEVQTAANEKIKFVSCINPVEGYFLYKLIKDNKLRNVLEIGMANGTSALYMCQAMKENLAGKLISIDPFQSTQWKGVGIANIKREKMGKYHELLETTSDLALPRFLEEGKTFDMVFVDGMHLFDYTLVDIYYAAKLLPVGGILVVDDIRHRGVKKVIDYVLANYANLEYVTLTMASETMGMFIKRGEDKRKWNYHMDF